MRKKPAKKAYLREKILKFVFTILLCQFAGFIGSIFTITAIPTWYASLNKPSFNPPNYLFGPVWTTLYILMGISFALILLNKTKNTKTAITFFSIQLALNALWSIIFFGMKMPLLAFINIILLWLAILFTMISFYRISKPSFWLLVPYILWVSFASALNLMIVVLN